MAVASVERRLAAILAADVVGYSRLMGEDENGTHARLKAHRKELIDPTIDGHRGHIVKLTGDGALVEFGSVVDAVACAVEIQRRMVERNADVPEHQRIQFRVGINLGDVIVEADDIYGDGVNISARLEALAQPGGICVSDLVHRSVEAKLDVAFDDLGELRLKNIAKPVRVYSIRTDPESASPILTRSGAVRWIGVVTAALVVLSAIGLVGWRFYMQPLLQERAYAEQTALPLPDKPSIAVLPFANMSGDPSQDYFGDGMTENLITNLSKLSGLFVIARNSVFTYKDRPVMVQQVGRELGVRYVLEGSVQEASDRVRIHAQLIDAATGYHLWAERFDRGLDDIFALQDEVTSDIVAALQVELSEAEERKLAQRYTSNFEAYDEFLKGWEQLFRGTMEANLRARGHFERAIRLDPEFARAYANLALTYVSGGSAVVVVPDASLETAYKLTQTAVALDDTLPQVHWVQSLVHLYRREYEKALAASDAAIALEPNFADAYGQQAFILNLKGRPKEALPLMKHAMRLNPRYPAGYLEELGKIQFALGRYDAAIATLEAARERNPSLGMVRLFLAASYVHVGRIGDAEWEIEEVLVANPDFSLKRIGEFIPYEHPDDLERLAEALEKAGLTS